MENVPTTEAESGGQEVPSGDARRPYRRRVTRAVTAGGIVIGTLAVAGPSWAGPVMGC